MKRKIIAAVGVIVILIVSVICSFITQETAIYNGDKKVEKKVVTELVSGVTLSEEFTAPKESIDGLKLRFATYARACTGTVEVSITDIASGKRIMSESIDASKLQDNSYYTIRYEQPLVINNQKIKLEVKGIDTVAGSAPTIYAYQATAADTELTLQTGEKIDNTLDVLLLQDVFSVQRLCYLCFSMLLIYAYCFVIAKLIIKRK